MFNFAISVNTLFDYNEKYKTTKRFYIIYNTFILIILFDYSKTFVAMFVMMKIQIYVNDCEYYRKKIIDIIEIVDFIIYFFLNLINISIVFAIIATIPMVITIIFTILSIVVFVLIVIIVQIDIIAFFVIFAIKIAITIF